MSSSLKWEPSEREQGTFSTAVKFALRKRFGEPLHVTLSEKDRPYLEGLRDAGVEGANEVLDAIAKYGAIDLDEVY